MSEVNQGKSMTLYNLIIEFVTQYKGNVYVFGVPDEVLREIGSEQIKPFSSVLELERIKDGIVIIDETGSLFNLNNRKEHRMIERTLRMVAHHNNRIVLAGLPDNFRKFISSLATGFMFKSLNLKSLINGSHGKEILLQYSGQEIGAFTLDIPINKVLCYSQVPIDGACFWLENVVYMQELDTKAKNVQLFVPKIL